MDSKRGGKSIDELGGTTVGEELGKSPLQSYVTLNGVSWLDVNGTSWGQVKLEDILYSDVSVFTTEALFD